jgi:hypothetical protein
MFQPHRTSPSCEGRENRYWSPVTCIATFEQVDRAGPAEALLGRLCARETVRVLDAALLTWPVDEAVPSVRPLENLPRRHALPQELWSAYCAPDRPTTGLLPTPPVPAEPGGAAIVAFCWTPDIDALTAALCTAGAQVRHTPLDPARYAQVRRGPAVRGTHRPA